MELHPKGMKSPNHRSLFSLHFLAASTIFVLLFISSTVMLYVTSQNLRSARNVAIESLNSIASALSLSAIQAMKANNDMVTKEVQTIFTDRIVAYAFMADRSGRILFHTNPVLSGSTIDEQVVENLFRYRVGTGQRITLRTGTGAYQYTYPLKGLGGQDLLLALVLNSLPADRLMAKGRQMWWVVGSALVIFWIMGIFFVWFLVHYIRLQEELGLKKHLALIGQMTAVLSHEIRNALGSIKGYTQWIDRKMEPNDRLREPVAMALSGIERVESLVKELLQYSRDERHRPERLNVVHLLEEACLPFKEWPGETVLDRKREEWVFADKEKLYRVFVNVIQNAVQAMGQTGTLEISVRRSGRWCRLQFEDSGPGIPPEEADRVFTPFYTSKVDGTGIGLAYSRKVIEAMGGRIELVNRRGAKGALLTIHLPRDRKGKPENAWIDPGS